MSKRRTKLSATSVILLLSFLFFAPCGYCSEKVYTITETQLTALQNHLTELEQNNDLLMNLLTEQDSESTKVLKMLMESKSELSTLRNQLNEAKQETQSAKESLRIANEELKIASQSFKAYEAERDRTESRLRAQRNIWEVLFAIAVIGATVGG